jgi:hypothetical protein
VSTARVALRRTLFQSNLAPWCPPIYVHRVNVGIRIYDLDCIRHLGSLINDTAAIDLARRLASAWLVPREGGEACSQHPLHHRQVHPEECAVSRRIAMHEHDDWKRPAPFRQPEIFDEPERAGLEGDLLDPGRLGLPCTRRDQ